jgi:hypothetical protein
LLTDIAQAIGNHANDALVDDWRCADRRLVAIRALLNPAVSTCARLLAMVSAFCGCACMPAAAIWSASNMTVPCGGAGRCRSKFGGDEVANRR